MEKPTPFPPQNNAPPYHDPNAPQYHDPNAPQYHDPNAPQFHDPNAPPPPPVASPPIYDGQGTPPVHNHPGGLPADGSVPMQNGPVHHHHNLTSIPIANLQVQSSPVICPGCGVREMTVTTVESGGYTHAAAAIVCFLTCLGCIPYCISGLKDVHHKCGRCGIPLARYHRSGRTEVLCYAK